MELDDWLKNNRAAIEKRVAFLKDLPDGIIHERPGTMHNLMIRKIGSRLELVFLGGESSEVISDFDYADPLDLYAGFTQAMTLGLLWKPQPTRVYVLGFGAGRVPMVLHHYYPEIVVESTDIDEDVVAVAREFCGMVTDERQKVFVEDGRQFLVDRDLDVQYDIIMVDAFRGVGFSPPLLATQEFYGLCKNHLVDDGVVVVNLMGSDYLFHDKIKTLMACFKSVHCVFVPTDGTIVLFASDGKNLGPAKLIERANAIHDEHQFAFPFVEHANKLQDVSKISEFTDALANATTLSDSSASRPASQIESKSGVDDPDKFAASRKRVGRNEPCPCGSGKKFKKCCGRRTVDEGDVLDSIF